MEPIVNRRFDGFKGASAAAAGSGLWGSHK
jgi:hypothetical protein